MNDKMEMGWTGLVGRIGRVPVSPIGLIAGVAGGLQLRQRRTSLLKRLLEWR